MFAIDGDDEAREEAHREAARRVDECLASGELVAFVTLGDPNVYSTFHHLAACVAELRPGIADRRPCPASWPSRSWPRGPGPSCSTVPSDCTSSARREGSTCSTCRWPIPRPRIVVYKGGRHLPALAERLEAAGRLEGSVYGELLGLPGERIAPLEESAHGPATYLASVIVPPRRQPRRVTSIRPMISMVGAGPGAPDLLTLRGRDRLASADVVVWASSLVPEAMLVHARPGAEVHDSKSMTLEDVIDVYASRPDAAIVRLHSGDPSIYGAIQEQIDWCVANQRDFEVVPGVSSLGASAAALRRELTIPSVAQSVVVTRLAGRTSASMPPRESVAAFSAIGATMAVFLSAARPVDLQARAAGDRLGVRALDPGGIVVRATWPDERVLPTTVGRLAETAGELGGAHHGPRARRARAGRCRLAQPPLLSALRARAPPTLEPRLDRGKAGVTRRPHRGSRRRSLR